MSSDSEVELGEDSKIAGGAKKLDEKEGDQVSSRTSKSVLHLIAIKAIDIIRNDIFLIQRCALFLNEPERIPTYHFTYVFSFCINL